MSNRTYRALLIANSTFPTDPHNLPDLEGPRNDPALLRDALCDHRYGLFPTDNVRLVTERDMAEVLEETATFLNGAHRDDTLLLYYSGHGRLDLSNELYLCTRNSRVDLLRATAVKASDLRAMIDESAAATTIVVLDCCHSGAFKGGSFAEKLTGRGRFVVTSCRTGELANDSAAANHASLFTHHLVQGMLGGAADRDADGFVNLDDLYSYIHDHLTAERPQIPEKSFAGSGDIPIARRSTTTDQLTERRVVDPSIEPILDVAPPVVELSNVEVGEDLPPERIAVINRGGGELTWTARCLGNPEWVTLERDEHGLLLHLQPPKPGINRANIEIRDDHTGIIQTVRLLVRATPPERPTQPPASDTSAHAAAPSDLRPSHADAGISDAVTQPSTPADSESSEEPREDREAADQAQVAWGLISPSRTGRHERQDAARQAQLQAIARGLHALISARRQPGDTIQAYEPRETPQQAPETNEADNAATRMTEEAPNRGPGTDDQRLEVPLLAILRRGPGEATGWTPRLDGGSRVLKGHARAVNQVCAVQVGARMLVASGDDAGTVWLWDPTTGQTVGSPFTADDLEVNALCAIPRGDHMLLASAGLDGIVLWDPITLHAIRRLDEVQIVGTDVMCAIPVGDRMLLATVTDKVIQLWDPETSERVGNPLKGHSRPVRSLCAIPEGDRTLLVSGADDETVRLWDPTSGQTVSRPFTSHEGPVLALCAVPADGRMRLASADADNTRLWDPTTGETIDQLPDRRFKRPRPATRRHPKFGQTVDRLPDRRIMLPRPATRPDPNDEEAVGQLPEVHVGVVTMCAIPVGNRMVLASAAADNTLRLWDPTGRRSVAWSVQQFHGGGMVGRIKSWMGEYEYVNVRCSSMCAVPVGDRWLLASGHSDGTIRLWDPMHFLE